MQRISHRERAGISLAASRRRRAHAAIALLAGIAPAVAAAELSVPYVPTPQQVVERMLEIAEVSSSDYLIDLGSGDGRIVITAAKKYGARGFGVDLNPQRIAEAHTNARQAGVADRVAFYPRDLFDTDLSQATVITMYLLPRVNLELRPKLLDLKPGTRIVSHDFSMDDWKADVHERLKVGDKYGGAGGDSDIYFWVVPAKVAGTWRWRSTVGGKEHAYEVMLDQKFQEISGAVRTGGHSARLVNPRLRGDRIEFGFTVAVDGAPLRHEFSGRVEGDAIAGTVTLAGSRLQSQLDWNAQRIASGGRTK